MIPLVLDRVIPNHSDCPVTLLQLPVGATTIIERILHGFPIQPEDEVLLFRPHSAHAKYEGMSVEPRTRIVQSRRELQDVIARLPRTDQICFIDTGLQPLHSLPLRAIARQHRNYPGVVAILGKDSTGARIQERVIANRSGEVIEIKRVFPQSSGFDEETTKPLALLMPACVCHELHFHSIQETLTSLKRAGRLCIDVMTEEAVYELTSRDGLLGFQEGISDEPITAPHVVMKRKNGSWIQRGPCDVSPYAHLTGRVFIHEGAVIEAHAHLIGPVTIGAHGKVGRSAVVTDGIVVPGGEIAAEQVVAHKTVYRHGAEENRPSRNEGEHYRSTIFQSPIVHASPQPGCVATAKPTLYDLAKRATDILISGLALILLSPVFAVIAVLMRIDSPGPTLFTHRREGRDGRDFPCLKFRTMHVGAHHRQRELSARNELDGPQFKIESDPRVTHIGRFLRVTNLDELPQLINVFLGHMSLVGPRPSPFRENQVCIPWRRARLSVRPGITGLWQLCRDRSQSSDFHQWIFYDLMYVRRRSTVVDWKILALTLLTLGGQRTVPMNWLVAEPGDEPSASFLGWRNTTSS